MPIPYETLFILIIKMTVHSFIQRRHLVSKYMIIPSVVLTESAGSSVITDRVRDSVLKPHDNSSDDNRNVQKLPCMKMGRSGSGSIHIHQALPRKLSRNSKFNLISVRIVTESDEAFLQTKDACHFWQLNSLYHGIQVLLPVPDG